MTREGDHAAVVGSMSLTVLIEEENVGRRILD